MGGGQGVPTQPQYAVAGVVRQHAPGGHHIDEFRRLHHTGDAKGLPPPVDDGGKAVARRQIVSFGETLDHRHFPATTGMRQAPLAQKQAVDPGLSFRRQGHEPGRHWLVEPRNLQLGRSLHPRGHSLNPGQPGDHRRQVTRGAFQGHENIGKPVIVVVGGPRRDQRGVVRQRQHTDRHAAGNHQGDRQHLSAHPPQLPANLGVEHGRGQGHRITSSAPGGPAGCGYGARR